MKLFPTRLPFHAKAKLALLTFLPLLLALACNQAINLPFLGPTATPSPTPTPTETPTPTPTLTPTPTPTPVPAARIAEGDRAIFNGDYERAVSDFQVAQQASSDPELQRAAQLGIGRAQADAGNPKAAVETLMAFIQNYPDSNELPYAYFTLAQAYMSLEQYSEAAEAYFNYLANRPGLVDAYVLEMRGDALRAAGDNPGAINDYRAAIGSPSTLNPLLIEIKIGRAYLAIGDYANALGMFADIYNRASTDFTRAQMDVLMGQSYLGMGQTDQAYAAYQDAVTNFPTTYDAYTALLALVEAGVPVNELNRGIVDYYAGQYGVALAALDRYLQENPPDPAAARYFTGLTQRALGGYDGALEQWDRLIDNYPDDRYAEKAYEQKAYTQWAYMEKFPEAVQTLLEFVTKHPAHARAAEFLYDAASVAEQNNNLTQAAELWERVSTEYPADERAYRALLLAGVSRYRLADYAGAQALLQRLLGIAVSLDQRAAAYFWQGKALNAGGDSAGAQAAWEQASVTDPTGYYSERARDILRNRAPFAPIQTLDLTVDLPTERARAEEWLRATFGLSEATDLSSPGPLATDPRLIRGTELWKLGLQDDARAEFEALRIEVQNDAANTYRLANYLLEVGSYRQAILAARQVLTLAGLDDAATLNAPAYFNHLRFGTYFSDLILPQAQANGFDPMFLFSVVRQESAFEGFVRSSAGARGLMQIMPATGQEIVSKSGWPPDYTDDDLYRPYVNITLGTDYLATWRDKLDGDLYAALAAYNGGPGNATAWHTLAPDDPDLFLEIVRYEETRTYIRSVYENYALYRKIYERAP
jgi:soluble lytic murein transglycosylase